MRSESARGGFVASMLIVAITLSEVTGGMLLSPVLLKLHYLYQSFSSPRLKLPLKKTPTRSPVQ